MTGCCYLLLPAHTKTSKGTQGTTYVRSEVATAAKKQCAFHHFHQISAEGVMDAVCAASVRACFHVPCPSTPIFLVAVHFMLLVRQSISSSNVTQLQRDT